MKRFRFNKIKWDKIISAVVVVVLLVGCVAGLAAIFGSKTTDVSDFEFKKGALDSAGFYVESDTSIYTKDLIECQGLVIEPDFEATGDYQVFYYGADKAFIGATELMDAHTDGIYEKGDTFVFAKYCRIVISPDTPTDNDGYPIDDWKIHFWDVAGYADDYKISVNKNQKYSLSKALESCVDVADVLGEGVWNNQTDTFKAEASGMYFFNVVDVEGKNTLIMKVATETLTNTVIYADGQVFNFPILYDVAGSIIAEGTDGIGYTVLERNAEFTYISYDVSAYTSVVGAVDMASVDVLEIYVQ